MSEGKRCRQCGYPVYHDLPPDVRARRDVAIHWRVCEPRKRWPAFMARKTASVATDAAVASAERWRDEPFAPPLGGIEAVSGEASAPGSFEVLLDVVDAGISPAPEAALSTLDVDTVDIYVGASHNLRDVPQLAATVRTCLHCGRVSKSNAGNAAHMRSHKVVTK
jgi:hypothetical protein